MGWIKLDRQIVDNFLYSAEPFDKCHAWIDLLLLASHEDEEFMYKGQLIKLQRGQLITSPAKLAKRWKWSKNKAFRFLGVLSDAGMVYRSGSPDGTTLTIVNYDKFQNRRTTNGVTDGVADGSPDGSPDGPHSRSIRNKEYKNSPTNRFDWMDKWVEEGDRNDSNKDGIQFDDENT